MGACFIGEEIKGAIFSMEDFKAPGPDGLHPVFFKTYWEMIGSSVVDYIQDIYSHPDRVKDINDLAVQDVPVTKVYEFVKELSLGDGSWLFDRISPWLPTTTVAKISSRMAGRDDLGSDRIIWRLSNDGTFTTKSAYNSILNFPSTTNSTQWRHLWHWQGPVRAKYFLWLVVKGGLKTNLLRWERGCSDSSICPLCHIHEESDSHILRDCTFVAEVWDLIFCRDRHGLQMDVPLTSWIFQHVGLQFVHQSGVSYSLLFGITCWLIWRYRNDVIFQDFNWDPIQVANHIWTSARDFLLAMGCQLPAVSSRQCISKDVGWEPPKDGWVKWDLDGSVRLQGVSATSGCVLRNSLGRWITGVTRNIGQATIT
ncbi:Reverse transcriptase zinc-binding domain [Sesbania bispinosa]|nr:Reverse transcriptase zinc-binding domain [Sesbania bispinosa]